MAKTPWRQLPPRQQAEIIGLLVLSVAVVAVAQNDLRRRPASQVRGHKILWQLVSLNALGALIYLCVGRVRSSEVTTGEDPGAVTG
ncbi:MAG: hypothetical protein J2P57_13015 [Acidimicrobiaceae bacterium]|nr:hypothetical protein [Acidimicrobiaceae bacterium]